MIKFDIKYNFILLLNRYLLIEESDRAHSFCKESTNLLFIWWGIWWEKYQKLKGIKIAVWKLEKTGDKWYLHDISSDIKATTARIDGNESSYVEVS